jgi:hypothetical protein
MSLRLWPARKPATAWTPEFPSTGRLARSEELPTLVGFSRHEPFTSLKGSADSGLLVLLGPQVASLLLAGPSLSRSASLTGVQCDRRSGGKLIG